MKSVTAWLSVAVTVVLLFAHSLNATEIVIQTGVASPQSKSEEDNIEKLRERAVRNALDLAMLQVAGALVTSERVNTIRSREETTINGDKIAEQTQLQSRFHGTVISRTTGYARLLALLKEWKDGDQYYVKAKIEVGSPEETPNGVDAGFLWERVGEPSINLSLLEKVNGQKIVAKDNKTLIYFRDNLVKNGINILSTVESACQYRIRVIQTFQTEQMSDYGTYTSYCKLSFAIEYQGQNTILSAYRVNNGPVAGFTPEQAQDGCIKGIAPEVSDRMVRNVATIMNDRWNKGSEYQLSIDDLPKENMTEASKILRNLFMVSSSTEITFQNNVLSMLMTYKGTGVGLAEAIGTSFDEVDWKVIPVTLEGNKVQLRWVNQKLNN